MSIVWLILKILGFVLLGILGLVILLILASLFVPIRYNGEVAFHKEEPITDDSELIKDVMEGKITWLCHLISVGINKNQNGKLRIKVLGIPIITRNLFTAKNEEEENTDQNNQEKKEVKIKKDKKTKKEEKEEKEEIEREEEKEEKSKKPSFWERLKMKKDRLVHKLKKAKALWDFIFDEKTKKAFNLIRDYTIVFLHHIAPDVLHGTFHFGFDSQLKMTLIMKAWSFVYPIWGDTIDMQPDLDKLAFDGSGEIKGKIYGVHVFGFLWHLYFCKEFRERYSAFKKWNAM